MNSADEEPSRKGSETIKNPDIEDIRRQYLQVLQYYWLQ